ncbi:sensor histidine kinase [Microbacterium sp. RD1]|uniref:sensor histidine kinase n=1 Tax=Microbacterium sp. RD1 TaxID=3457313 RepID=UPI003FA5AE14
MAWLSRDERRVRVEDSTRDRTILLNQLLLAGVTLIGALLALGLDQVARPTSFLVGAATVFIAAAAAVLVPWKRLPHWAGGILPIVDILAIAFIRESAPASGLGLLWAFPAMWIGSVFGLAGVVLSTVSVAGLLAVITLLEPVPVLSASQFLLPLTVGALATIAFLSARRAHAQRELLEKQSVHLQRSVDRARRQEDLVTEVLDAVDFGVVRITPDGQLAVTNEAHARLQGTSPIEDDLPVFAADGVTPLAPHEVPVARARQGETFENELVWYGVPGEGRRALAVTARPLTDIDGTSAGIVVVTRDVTGEEQALRAREDLVASVSHELRTPLTSIVGYLELVLDRPELTEATRHDLAIAERNAERLLELVTDILALSASSRHGVVELTLHPEPSDVSAIVTAAVESLAPRAAERHIGIDTSAVRPTMALIDPHRIRQVVDNLLTNAVKYNHDGGSVQVGVSEDGVHVWITVSDDGPGISDEERPLLFDRFFRSDAVRNSTTHGSGLGLAISRDFVTAHGGEIFVETQPGRGSTFTVRLPVAPGEDRA